MLYLSLMDATTNPNQRGFERSRLSEPVAFQLKDPTQFGGCLSADISKSGIKVTFNEFIPVGTEIKLKVALKSDKMVDCIAKVMWVRQLPSEFYQAGLKFVKPENLILIIKKSRRSRAGSIRALIYVRPKGLHKICAH